MLHEQEELTLDLLRSAHRAVAQQPLANLLADKSGSKQNKSRSWHVRNTAVLVLNTPLRVLNTQKIEFEPRSNVGE